MGIPAARGRVFTPDERESGAPGVAVVSDELWRRRFGGDPSIVGQPVRVNEDEVTIVGVLPPGVRPFDVDIWFPHRPALLNDMQRDRANHPGFGVVARLRPGVSADRAQRELSAIAASLEKEYPASNTGFGVAVKPMIDAVAGTIRPMLRLLMQQRQLRDVQGRFLVDGQRAEPVARPCRRNQLVRWLAQAQGALRVLDRYLPRRRGADDDVIRREIAYYAIGQRTLAGHQPDERARIEEKLHERFFRFRVGFPSP